MSIFNNEDFTTNTDIDTILQNIESNYLRKNGTTESTALTTLNGQTNINSNLVCNQNIISPVDLGYLDGITSNIQQQITNNSNSNSGLTTTVNTHTTQISELQATYITNTNQI
jgi:hypothetical protein